MDPRHPELAVSRMRELMRHYDDIEKEMGKTTVSARLAQLEREGILVVQEICLVAPRLHEAMMQKSRNRRVELTRQIVMPTTDEEVKKSVEFFKDVEENNETYVAPNQAETVFVEPKPRKKKTVKKKGSE